MKAILLERFGLDQLNVQQQPMPTLRAGEVRVRTAACGVNPIDWKTCSGGGAAPFIGELPFIPGWELSGTVDAVANDVTTFNVGDPVLGLLRFPEPAGCYAEYVAAPANELALCPASLDLVNAGGLSLAGLTAWQALFDKGNLQSGQRVLITAAAGGVGHLAVQLAKWKGAQVIATASAHNHDWLTQLGADQCIDYNHGKLADQVQNMDLVLDGVGGDSGEAALACLNDTGVLVTLPSVTKDQLIAVGQAQGKRVEPIRVVANGEQLTELAQLCAQGTIQLTVAATRPLEEIDKAFADSASGHTRGKLILTL